MKSSGAPGLYILTFDHTDQEHESKIILPVYHSSDIGMRHLRL
jgi:hypothetical protein